MKRILFYLITVTVAVMAASCNGIYENIEKFSGEVVYPAKFDTILGYVGYERVEIDLMKAGRIPANQVNMGKAVKTVVEVDGKIVAEYDSLCSWVNITGLTQQKLYRLKIYTADQYGNQSVPQEIAMVPFTSYDKETLAVPSPRVMSSPSAAIVDWPTGISSVVLDFYSFEYEYTDKDGEKISGIKNSSDTRIFVGNIEIGEQVPLKITYKTVPRSSNNPILDTVYLERTITLNIPDGNTPFTVVEKDILAKNGVSVFTANGVASITKLTYPVHCSSFQDLFYFPNLKELDLTGGTLFPTPEQTYERNNAKSVIGNIPWTPLLTNVNNMAAADYQALLDMLEAGILTKVVYSPGSIEGGLDDALAPYVGTIVELLPVPDEVYIPNEYFVDGTICDNNWKVNYTFPASSPPAGNGLVDVYQITPVNPSSSFIFALPKEYKYNVKTYPYLKFKVYMPPEDEINDYFQLLWPRFMNFWWGGFDSDSQYGQEYWAPNYMWMTKFQEWADITVPLNDAFNRHNRAIVINIGYEQGRTPNAGLVYYFANFRLSKTN
jgi:hypothetical protein